MKMGWRNRLHEIVFESDTKAGRVFDVLLISTILLSILLVMLESVHAVRDQVGYELYVAEWFFTIIFSIEYALRLISVKRPVKYALSFFGIVDLVAILPTYLSLFVPGAQSLLVLRVFRILRIFRIFKLGTYVDEANMLSTALLASRAKITVFLFVVGTTVVSMGSIMYLIEGEANGFPSIPTSIYWAIVTMTTVGFGDITPKTPLGQFLSSCLMIIGYGVIAVPTGIVTNELARATLQPRVSTQACPNCSLQGHDFDARFCKYCGHRL